MTSFSSNYRQIHIDSQFGQGTDSDFTFYLPEPLQTSQDTRVYCHNISIPLSWNTIDGTDNKLYLHEQAPTMSGLDTATRIITIPSGTYVATDLADLLYQQLILGGIIGEYTGAYWQCSLQNSQYLLVTIIYPGPHTGDEFYFFSDIDLSNPQFRSAWVDLGNGSIGPAPALPPLQGNPGTADAVVTYSSANTVFGFTKTSTSGLSFVEQTYACSSCDVRHYSKIYLCSDTVTNFASIMPNWNRSCIKAIGVNDAFGQVLSQLGSSDDALPAGDITAKSLHFQLLDGYGNVINMNGSHISFTLAFVD
jgi:hypothetical protein